MTGVGDIQDIGITLVLISVLAMLRDLAVVSHLVVLGELAVVVLLAGQVVVEEGGKAALGGAAAVVVVGKDWELAVVEVG